MAYYSMYGKKLKRKKKKKKKNRIKIFTKTNVLAFLLLIAIFFAAWYVLSHYFVGDYHYEKPVTEDPLADPITDFNHTYGELRGDTLAQIDRNEIDGIDQVEQYAKDFVISAGGIDYRTITGYEGYELTTSELQQYLEDSGDPVTKKETCKYHQMVRTASDPQIRKVINFSEQGFYYVEAYCDLTLAESNDTFSPKRWPDGIGSTIEGRWRLEFVKQDNIYKINEIDVLETWDEQRNLKYNKYKKLITTVE